MDAFFYELGRLVSAIICGSLFVILIQVGASFIKGLLKELFGIKL